MAPEPLHLVNITKTCPRCNSEDVKFSFYNNYKLSQPRYKCKGCGQLFTYGGMCRAPRVAQPPRTSTTSTAVVAEDRRTGPDQRGGPRRSQRVTPATREIQETPATCGRTEERTASICARTRARTVPTCARTEALTVTAAPVVRPSVGALRLPRIPISEQRESPVQSPVQSPVVSPIVSPIVSSVESPAVGGPDPTTRRIAGVVPGDVVDAASRTAATVMAQGDVKQNWTKAVLGISPFDLVAARNGKQMKVLRVKYDGKETHIPFWVTES